MDAVEVPGLEDTQSQVLFAKAQRALATGDATSAKSLALRAAAEIASAEVASSERLLQQCESRLKISMDSTVGARGAVKESEKMVKSVGNYNALCLR